MSRIYYRLLRDIAAVRILAALVASPQRYDYISDKVRTGELSNEQATHKNVTKAIIMADQLIDGIKQRNTLDS